MKLKSVLAASAGGALEWYDFVVLGIFAEILGKQFFPNDNIYVQNLLVFLVFALGYITRPIGALVFGHIGDKYGRKKSLYYTMIFSGTATAMLALTPTYQQIGILASIIFFLARVLQGLSVGGSITGALVYVSEITPKNKLCFWMTQVLNGINRGWFLASFISFLLFHYMRKKMLYNWGWRVAFICGTIIMLLALYFRRQLPESTHHEILKKNDEVKHDPVAFLFRNQGVNIAISCGISVLFSVLSIILLVYLPSFFRYYDVPQKYIVDINLVSSLSFGLALPIFGYLGDKIGAKLLLMYGSIFIIIVAESCTRMLTSHHKLTLCIGSVLLSTMTAAIVAATPPLLVNMFPTTTRNTGVGFSFNLVGSLSVFVWPITIPILTNKFGSLIYSSSLLLMISATITFCSCILLRNRKELFKDHVIE